MVDMFVGYQGLGRKASMSLPVGSTPAPALEESFDVGELGATVALDTAISTTWATTRNPTLRGPSRWGLLEPQNGLRRVFIILAVCSRQELWCAGEVEQVDVWVTATPTILETTNTLQRLALLILAVALLPCK